MKFPLTVRKKKLYAGVSIIIFLVITPFLFYLYRFAPSDTNVMETKFFIINSGGFKSVQGFTHALFTKLTLVFLVTLWFLTCRHWWKWSLLVPLTLFLFQLTGVINHALEYIDNYDFWYSLPVVIPVICFLVYIKNKIRFYTDSIDLKEELDTEIEKLNHEFI